jgi:hypothetical protein
MRYTSANTPSKKKRSRSIKSAVAAAKTKASPNTQVSHLGRLENGSGMNGVLGYLMNFRLLQSRGLVLPPQLKLGFIILINQFGSSL